MQHKLLQPVYLLKNAHSSPSKIKFDVKQNKLNTKGTINSILLNLLNCRRKNWMQIVTKSITYGLKAG